GARRQSHARRDRRGGRRQGEERQGSAVPRPRSPAGAPFEAGARPMRCPQEAHVLHAATENAWTDALRAHVVSCESCAAAAGVAPFMAHLAGVEVPRSLPDPTLLWIRSQLPPPAGPGEGGRPGRIAPPPAYLTVTAGAVDSR